MKNKGEIIRIELIEINERYVAKVFINISNIKIIYTTSVLNIKSETARAEDTHRHAKHLKSGS